MGRIVINETENKQTVVLNDSPEGVNGGYFDSKMNWHEMGSGEGYLIYDVTDQLVLHGTLSNNASSNYFAVNNNSRLSAKRFYSIEPGATLSFKVESDKPEAEMVINYYSEKAIDSVMSHGDINTSDYSSFGWEKVNNTIEHTFPDTLNSSKVVAIRFSFRADSSNSVISTNFVKDLKVLGV